MDPYATKIFIDGACDNNGTPDARASIGVFFGNNDSRNISKLLPGTEQTNNRAEISAAIIALLNTKPHEKVIIITDSEYLKSAMTNWIQSWVSNGWKNSQKKPVKNKDLFLKLLEIENEKKESGGGVVWKWVKGHSKCEGNIMADKLARSALDNLDLKNTIEESTLTPHENPKSPTTIISNKVEGKQQLKIKIAKQQFQLTVDEEVTEIEVDILSELEVQITLKNQSGKESLYSLAMSGPKTGHSK